MFTNPQTFIFFGPSGSGKKTQAELLKEYLERENSERKVVYVETGQKLREFIAENNSYTRDLTKEVIDKGDLMPEFMPIWIWSDFLINNLNKEDHLILDGLSRRKHEAPILHGALRFYNRNNPFVIEMDITKKVAMERLLNRGRSDDIQKQIENRLNWYEEHTKPALKYFVDHSDYRHIRVDADKDIDTVHNKIIEAIK